MRLFILVIFWAQIFALFCRLIVVTRSDNSEKKIESLLYMVLAGPLAAWAGYLLWA